MQPNLHRHLIARGVVLHAPETLTLELEPEQLAPGVELYPGCRISGAGTSIGPGCRIGREGPVTLIDCQLGAAVHVAGGFAEGATLLDGVRTGAGVHIRPGTLLEEASSCAHSVGLKQTLLMPWVTLGSLINFCDVLMAGGTGPRHHGEVGSSFVHFNFTPRQDKATASLIGDVPGGVMLDRPPVFLGGQGGLVGPVRVAFGTVMAAGVISRRDVLDEGLLVFGQTGGRQKDSPYESRLYGDIDRLCRHTFRYAGNLHALAAWYRHVRTCVMRDDPYTQACLAGGLRQLAIMAAERCSQLEKVAARVAVQAGPPHVSHRKLMALRPALPALLRLPDSSPAPPTELREALAGPAVPYVDGIQGLAAGARRAGTAWLQAIVDTIEHHWEEITP